LKTFEFTNLPPSFFEKTSLIEEFMDKNINDDCYLDEFDFCIIANETNSGGTQKLIFRNLVVVTLRLIYFYYRNAELSSDNKKLTSKNSENHKFSKERNSILKKINNSQSKSSNSSNQKHLQVGGFLKKGFDPVPLLKDFCSKVCVELSANDIERFLFGYLKMSIDDTLKTTIVEILNSMDVTMFKLVQIESIFHLMQEAKDFTKGKNELVYGNLLLILTKFLCCSSYAENFIKNFGSEWVYELFEMLQKNTHRNVMHDPNEQREKDILNCCFLHFICNFSTFMELIEMDQSKLLNYGHQILKNEITSNPQVSPPLEIEKSFLGDNHKNLISFLHDSKAETLQYFRILNYLASCLDGTQLSKNCFKGNLLVNQKELYFSSFDKIRDIIMGELLYFSENPENSAASSKFQSSNHSSKVSVQLTIGKHLHSMDVNEMTPTIMEIVGAVPDFLNQQVDFFEKRKYEMVSSFIKYISPVDFHEIENSIASGAGLFISSLTYKFEEYEMLNLGLVKKFKRMRRNSKFHFANKDTGFSFEKENYQGFQNKKKILKKILISRASEIGCRHSRIKPKTFSSKRHSMMSPEMIIFSSSQESCIDIDQMLLIFNRAYNCSPKNFLNSFTKSPQCLLFASFNSILRIFRTSLTRTQDSNEIQPATTFLSVTNFIKLFFFLQLFGPESLNLGSKFVQSNPSLLLIPSSQPLYTEDPSQSKCTDQSLPNSLSSFQSIKHFNCPTPFISFSTGVSA
jgi:hypothetical protein